MQAGRQLEVRRLLLPLPVKQQQHCPGRRKENLSAATLAYMTVAAPVRREYSNVFDTRAQCRTVLPSVGGGPGQKRAACR